MFNTLIIIGFPGQYTCFLNMNKEQAIEAFKDLIEETWGEEHRDQFTDMMEVHEHTFTNRFTVTGVWNVTDNRPSIVTEGKDQADGKRVDGCDG